MSAEVWVVTWMHNYQTHAIDFWSKAEAESFALKLAEAPTRTKVLVTKTDFEPDPAQVAAVKERVWRALKSHAMGEAIREAAG